MPGDVVGRAEGEEHGRCGEGSSQHSANCLRRVRGPPCCHSGGPPATMGGPSAQRRPHSGRPQFEGGRPEGGPAAQARRPGRPIGPPDLRGWPPTFGWRAARFWSEGRPIWRPGGPGGGRAARSPLTADSTTYGTPVPTGDDEYAPINLGTRPGRRCWTAVRDRRSGPCRAPPKGTASRSPAARAVPKTFAASCDSLPIAASCSPASLPSSARSGVIYLSYLEGNPRRCAELMWWNKRPPAQPRPKCGARSRSCSAWPPSARSR
jgi:hypothetical protein